MIIKREQSRHQKFPKFNWNNLPSTKSYHLIDNGGLVNKVFGSMTSANAVWSQDSWHSECKHRIQMELYRQQWLYKESLLFVLADSKPYWRTEVFPEYKQVASRFVVNELAEKAGYTKEMLWQDSLEATKEWVDINGGVYLTVEGCEADDLAYVLSTMAHNKNIAVSAYCNDADWTQLAAWAPGTEILFFNRKRPDGITGEWLHTPTVAEARDDLLLKIAVGDKSDNIKPCFLKQKKDGTFSAMKWAESGLRSQAEELNLSIHELITKLRKECPGGEEQYVNNNTLINMNKIPKEIQDRIKAGFKSAYKGKNPNDQHKFYAEGTKAYEYLKNYYGEDF